MEIAAVAGFGEAFIRVKTLNDTYKYYLDVNGDDTIVNFDGLLRETPVLIQKMDYCEDEKESDTVICAGGVNHGSTRGDSGGPLLVIRQHRWIQYGVSSIANEKPIPGDILSYSNQGLFIFTT
uniref:Peptidase S1 domain-containing protein n=1 Tax=Panagrolaimus superbus TaxID=310955 RepID=A0A914Z7G5_9BILA